MRTQKGILWHPLEMSLFLQSKWERKTSSSEIGIQNCSRRDQSAQWVSYHKCIHSANRELMREIEAAFPVLHSESKGKQVKSSSKCCPVTVTIYLLLIVSTRLVFLKLYVTITNFLNSLRVIKISSLYQIMSYLLLCVVFYILLTSLFGGRTVMVVREPTVDLQMCYWIRSGIPYNHANFLPFFLYPSFCFSS